MIYDLLAPIYDKINKDISYGDWADYIERLFGKYSVNKPELVLDLGCGTGKMTLELARRGYDMTGVDLSVEMLDVAREEAASVGLDGRILWLCQDMREFELYGTVDAVVSCLDCVNHLTSPKDLRKCFALVHNYLIPDGIFIFDVNGKRRFTEDYGKNAYVMEQEDSFCVWQNDYNPKSNICDFYITLFSESEDGTYLRHDELQRERMYTLRSLKAALSDCGLELLGAFSDYDMAPATDDDKRIYLVARCLKEG